MSPAELRTQARNLLFLDIETAAGYASYTDLPPRLRQAWQRKAANLKNTEGLSEADLYRQRAALYAEFGQVIVIGLGLLYFDDAGHCRLRVHSLSGPDEATLLQQFADFLRKHYPKSLTLCAHNGREFDYPYLCRRMLINGVAIPKVLWDPLRKRFEMQHIDTMELWKFGDFKHYVSLELLATAFGLPSSKSQLSGDRVSETYHVYHDLGKIVNYCLEDVIVLAQLFLRFQHLPALPPDRIERAAGSS